MATTFNINTKAINETATLHLVDVETKQPLYADEAEKFPLQIVLNGKASKAYRAALSSLARKSEARKGKNTFDQNVQSNNELLADISVEAVNFDMGDGKPIKTKEQFMELYATKGLYWIKDQVSEFLEDDASFLLK